MEHTSRDVTEFLATLDGPNADSLRALDAIIAEAFAGLTRELWEGKFWGGTDQQIIGYGHIQQPRPRGAAVEWFVVGLARQTNHLSVYVNAAEEGEYLVQRWKNRLGAVQVGSAALTFASIDSLDLDEFRILLGEAVRLAPSAT